MFPTGVGMNRSAGTGEVNIIDVPHRRGDEPVVYVWPIPIL